MVLFVIKRTQFSLKALNFFQRSWLNKNIEFKSIDCSFVLQNVDKI